MGDRWPQPVGNGSGENPDRPDDTLVSPALTQAAGLVREVLQRAGFGYSNDEVIANAKAVYALASTVEAAKLWFLAELSARPDLIHQVAPPRRVGRRAMLR